MKIKLALLFAILELSVVPCFSFNQVSGVDLKQFLYIQQDSKSWTVPDSSSVFKVAVISLPYSPFNPLLTYSSSRQTAPVAANRQLIPRGDQGWQCGIYGCISLSPWRNAPRFCRQDFEGSSATKCK